MGGYRNRFGTPDVAMGNALMVTESNPLPSATYTLGVKAALLNRILLVLSLIGLFVASALSIEKLMHVVLPCGNTSGCATVAADPSSMLFGVIPVAYIGFGGYLFLAALALIRTVRSPNDAQLVKIGLVASAFGAGFSIYLQYLSFFHIHAVCPYCLTSAITMIATLVGYVMLYGTIKQGAAPKGEMTKADMWIVGAALALIVIVLPLMGSAKAPGMDNDKIEANKQHLIPPNPNVYGPADAKLTIVEFADLCCPACQEKSPLVKDFARSHPNTVRIIFREFPLKVHQYGRVAATMAEYAAEKGKLWDFVLNVMGLRRQPESINEMLDIAKSLGMDPDDMKKRLTDSSDPIFSRVTRDINDGTAMGVTSTPTFILVRDGHKLDSAGPFDIMDKLAAPDIQALVNGNG
jgi:protein-disulfide isomerase/uncharacterized membrane protein